MDDDEKIVPIRKPEVIAEVGGMVDECRVTLAVYGDDLDPDRVSVLLGAKPTSAHRRGDRRKHSGLPYKHGAWLLTLEARSPTGPDELIRTLLRPFPADRQFWEGLRAEYTVRVSIGIFTSTWNRGFELQADTVCLLATTGAEVGFDIYCDGDETED